MKKQKPCDKIINREEMGEGWDKIQITRGSGWNKD